MRSPRINLQSITGLILLAAAIMMILFSGSSPLNQKEIEARLAQFAEHVAKSAEKAGRQGSFTYGPITTRGWGFDKQLVVENVSLVISEKELLDTPKWSVSTTRMLVRSAPAHRGGMTFVFPEPINLIRNSQLKTSISGSDPIQYSFWEGEQSGHVREHVLRLPSEIDLDPPNAAGDSEHHGRVMIHFDGMQTITSRVMPDTGEREIQYDLRGLRIDDETGVRVAAASVGGKGLSKSGEVTEGQYGWQATGVTFGGAESNKPYTMEITADYRGDKPQFDLHSLMPEVSNMQVALKRLALLGVDFNVVASGHVTAVPTDPLPFGEINVDIEHAGIMLENLFTDPLKSAIANALQTVTKQPVAADTHVTLALKREQNGVFYIGESTFETLTALVLKDMLKGTPQQPVEPVPPVLPPATESPSAPENAPASEPPATEGM